MRIQQSICVPIMATDEMSLESLCHLAAGIGYAAVEFWGRDEDFDATAAMVRQHDLIIASMTGTSSLTEGLNDRANHARIIDELHASIDVAVTYGIPGIICFSGNRRPGVSDEEAIDITVEGLRKVAPYAERRGVTLNLELLNSKIDHPGYQADHTAWGVAVCERVQSPHVKLLYDIYHMQIMEGDLIRTIEQYIHWIGHFHTAGVPGRHDLDNHQELNYAGICRAIAATGYDRYVGHEYRPKGDLEESLRATYLLCDQE